MLNEMKSELAMTQSLTPAARTASANGAGVDLANCGRNMIVVAAGAVTDGTHTPAVQESDDNSSFTAVAAADLAGSLVAITANSVQRVGYLGAKRYVRVAVTVTGSPSTGGIYYAAVVKGGRRKQP
jgi:hypothetical protein